MYGGAGHAQIHKETYFILIVFFTSWALTFLLSRRLAGSTFISLGLGSAHLLEHTSPVLLLRRQGICDDFILAGLLLRCAYLLILILSLLCLPTRLRTTARLVLLPRMSKAASLFAHTLVPAALVV